MMSRLDWIKRQPHWAKTSTLHDGKTKPSADPLVYALLLAASLHVAVIFGIGFVPEDHAREETPRKSLRVVVAPPAPVPSEQSPQDTAAEVLPQEQLVETTPAPAPQPTPQPQAVVQPVPKPKPMAQKTPKQVAVVKPKPHPKSRPKPKPVKKPASQPKKRITAAQLLASRNDEIMRLNQELERKTTAYANRPRRKAISASTTEYKYATYLEAWRRKVERIGNLNYPDEARRKKLYGNLVLHVAVRADGSIDKIRILHSSGQKVLDDAAIRIVRLSAPFAPFPDDIRKEADVLDITRTWQFLSSNRLGWEK